SPRRCRAGCCADDHVGAWRSCSPPARRVSTETSDVRLDRSSDDTPAAADADRFDLSGGKQLVEVVSADTKQVSGCKDAKQSGHGCSLSGSGPRAAGVAAVVAGADGRGDGELAFDLGAP